MRMATAMFKALDTRLIDLAREGAEQRDILRTLVACVGQLKQSVDRLRGAV